MAKYIQIKNAEEVFEHKYFKLSGHNVISFLKKYKSKLDSSDYKKLEDYLYKLRKEKGDFEYYYLYVNHEMLDSE